MGVMLTQYPELFGALVCRQPLLDMRRFPALGGAAFIAEYGNPDDPADWEFIKEYSRRAAASARSSLLFSALRSAISVS